MWPFTSYPTLPPSSLSGKTYDYIIIGSGTAGCVLASRLSASGSASILVLEKGHVRDNFWTRIPLLSQNFRFPGMQAVKRWSEPVSFGETKMTPEIWSAEAVGGSSRINGMLLTRGAPGGYNAWREEFGLDEWGWERVEGYFRRSENAVGRPGAKHRGHEGPVENRPAEYEYGTARPFKEAARGLGLPVVGDMNDPAASAQGCFDLDQTVDGRGNRLSAYRAWLNARIAKERKGHLSVCTGVVASKLVLNEEANRVTAVRVQATDEPGKEYEVKARREVIICSGALCTPQLLMLSGIGPRDHLEEHGIPVKRESPWVGDLLDHVSAPIMVEVEQKDTIHRIENPFAFLWAFLLWLFFGTGMLADSSTPASVFYRTGSLDEKTMTVQERDEEGRDTMDASQPRNVPNVEVMLIPINCHRVALPGIYLFSFYTTIVQPFSHGRIKLASRDPHAHPKVHAPLFTDERDRVAMRTATRFSMHMAEKFAEHYDHPAPLVFYPGMDLDYLDSVHNGTWKKPAAGAARGPVPGGKVSTDKAATGVSVEETEEQKRLGATKTWRNVTDGEIDDYVKRVVQSTLHYTSTCRMSLDPKDGVVDQRLRVHGFENLRIADASVFPYIPSAHTMAPTIMVAERCADFLKAEWEDRKGK